MDPLTAILELLKTAGVPGGIAVLLIVTTNRKLDAIHAAVLSLPSRISQCQSETRSEPAALTPTTDKR